LAELGRAMRKTKVIKKRGEKAKRVIPRRNLDA